MNKPWDIVAIDTLSPDTIDEMYSIYKAHYDETTFHLFSRDLSEKSDCIMLYDEHRRLQGFSTLMLMSTRIDDSPVTAIFSGDTIVDPSLRTTSRLPAAWLDHAFSLLSTLRMPLFWFLISKGFRTYRFLPVFFKRFYPHPENEYRELHRITDVLAQKKFGAAYDPSTGIVHTGDLQPRLKNPGDIAGTTGRSDTYIDFFAKKNTFHTSGDELCCCTPVNFANMTPAGRRLLARMGKEPSE